VPKSKRGLGKGLEALIPPTSDQHPGAAEVDLDAISPNPMQPRQPVPPDDLEELAESIREHGLIQPLVVTRSEEGAYQLIAGERRWRAAGMAGLTSVPVVIKEASPQQMLELALVENIQRADLNPLEEAEAYRQLADEFELTQEQIAQRVAKSRVAVANSLRLLRLPEGAKVALAGGEISEGHARALLGVKDQKLQLKVLDQIRKRGLNVRQTEELVRRLNQGDAKPRPKPATSSPETKALEDDFRRALGTRVSLSQSSRGGGRLVIQFYSDEELERIYDLIVGE
jgi:ParB family chromosome partitioning protein